jgi:hypothetical protein
MARRSSLLKANPFIARQLQHPAPSEHTDDPLLKTALKGTDGAAWSPGVVRTLSGLIGNRATAQAVQRAIGPVSQMPAGQMTIQRDTASSIANGHSYSKHVVTQSEFPEIKNRAQFTALVRDIMQSPDEWYEGDGGRVAYWKGDTIVIYDPSSRDQGTCFRPTSGKRYFDNWT